MKYILFTSRTLLILKRRQRLESATAYMKCIKKEKEKEKKFKYMMLGE